MKNILLILFIIVSLDAKVYFYERDKKVYLKKDNTKVSTKRVKYFKNSKNELVIVKNQIVLKLNSVAVITKYILKYNLEIKKKFNNKKYIFTIPNVDDVFWISKELYNKTAVNYAYPVYVVKKQKKQQKQ